MLQLNQAAQSGGGLAHFTDSLDIAQPDDVAPIGEPGSATMILDLLGKVRYSDFLAAQLFRARAPLLLGLNIRELVPDLPLRPLTPGYNLAYAVFWAAEGLPRRFNGRDFDARSFGLELSLDPNELESRQRILLSLQALRAPAQSARRRFSPSWHLRAHRVQAGSRERQPPAQ